MHVPFPDSVRIHYFRQDLGGARLQTNLVVGVLRLAFLLWNDWGRGSIVSRQSSEDSLVVVERPRLLASYPH